jgi:hypothetical protein
MDRSDCRRPVLAHCRCSRGGFLLFAAEKCRRGTDDRRLAADSYAQARELAAAAVSNLNVDPERSILWVKEAIARSPTELPGVADALRQSIDSSRTQFSLRQNGKVWSLTFSPDGTRLATAGEDKSVTIWDTASGKPIQTLSGHAESHRLGRLQPGRQQARNRE